MFYRARQFWQAIFPRINSEELNWALNKLPPTAASLFMQQSLTEQRHAIDVAYDLWLTHAEYPNLIIAALLHDCGKSRYPLNVWERIYIVLLQRAPLKARERLLQSRPLFSSPLRTALDHPIWGATLALELGLDDEIIALIQYHHNPRTPLGRLLYEADNRH
jgi:hypothetical protein